MDIQDILQKGTSVMLVVSAQDLERFAQSILAKAEENQRANTQNAKGEEPKEDEEKYLSAKEVQELFGICSSTLWSWNKNGLLRHHKFGKKNVYALSDIRRFMNDHAKTDTITGYAQWHGKSMP